MPIIRIEFKIFGSDIEYHWNFLNVIEGNPQDAIAYKMNVEWSPTPKYLKGQDIEITRILIM